MNRVPCPSEYRLGDENIPGSPYYEPNEYEEDGYYYDENLEEWVLYDGPEDPGFDDPPEPDYWDEDEWGS